MKHLLDWKTWLYGLISGVISGIATAVSTTVGVYAVDSLKIADVKSLDWSQLGALTIVSGIVSAAMYLKKSPLPKEEVEIAPKTPTS